MPESDAGTPDAGIPLTLEMIRGTDQQGTVGVALPVPIVVAAIDTQFSGVGGVSIALSAPQGASVVPNPAVTSGDGKAVFTITLHAGGDHLFEASASGAPSISFHQVGLYPDGGP